MSNNKLPVKKMLINATQKEELRVALVEGQVIYNLDREVLNYNQNKGNIYLAKISRLEPSLEAAFINFGSERHGFLPLKEVNRSFFKTDPPHKARPHIRDVLKQGQEILVQVEKEERGNKGAALTTFISLAGLYLVLMPNNPKAGGVSRRVEGGERDELKNAIHELKIPEGMGVIIRTAGVGRSPEELQWDLDVLLTQWRAIEEATKGRAAPYLIYQESDVIIRALRDNLRPDISEILIDTPEAFEHVRNHIAHMRPDFVNRIKLYDDPIPLFNRYHIESQIESAHCREIDLPNGGSIVIDLTEALVAIDVNSSKATEGSNIEETALKTNLAAAKEIARQLRLRDLGGLIVIDFIDMSLAKNQRAVEDMLRDELKSDRARTRMRPLSTFGLLEMSRQRLRPSLGDSTQSNCPRCEGQGTIRTVPSLALALMRVIEEEGMKEHISQLRIQVPVDVATFLFNEKRDALIHLENLHKISIMLLPNPDFLTPRYEITRIRKGEEDNDSDMNSYQLTTRANKTEEVVKPTKKLPPEQPVIKHLTQLSAPSSHSKDTGIIRRLWSAIFGDSCETTSAKVSTPVLAAEPAARPARDNHNQHRSRRGNNNNHSNQPHRSKEPREPREPREAREPREQKNQSGNRQQHQKHRNDRHDNRNKSHEAVEHNVDSTPSIIAHAPAPANVPAKPVKPRTPTRPLRQSAAHPENIQKMQALNAAATAPTATPALVAAAPTTPVMAAAPVCAIPAVSPASAPVAKATPPAPKSEPAPQNSRKNRTGFTKLSNNDIEANFVKLSEDTIEKVEFREPLKQVQSKQDKSAIKQVQQPIVISEEFISNDEDK